MVNRTYLWVAFVALIAAAVALNVLIAMPQSGLTGNAVASSADIGICINSPPVVSTASCSNYSFVFYNYSCTLNVTDSQQSAFLYNVTKVSGPSAGDGLFNMTNGTLTFIPVASQVGNYTLNFKVNDGTVCGNSNTTAQLNISINFSNGAPYLVQNIPDQAWVANILLIAFDLDDYFADPDNDPLAYSVTGNTNVRIDIINGEVLLTAAYGWCGTELVVFRATDPTNLSADSNIVNLTVACYTPPSDPSDTEESSGGGGGGGGSNSDRQNSCVQDYSCLDWSSCQLTRAVDANTGNSQTIKVTGVFGSREFTVDDSYNNNPDVFYDGYQYRECIDTRGCDNKVKVYVRACTWTPSCSDNIQNQGETGVDCGGPLCAPCSTCSDGIQNGQEEGIDCGGPFCATCASCTNGKIDGKEIGVDCGGPDCPVCASCFDNVRNQDETGIDCGGAYCKACELEFPLAVPFPWLTVLFIVLIVAVLATLVIAAANKHIRSLLMRFLLKHQKVDRRIIISSNLKDEIIKRLQELENVVDTQPMLRSQEQLARIIRDYFKEALHLDFEFTNEEMIASLQENKLDPLLSKIMQQFFYRISYIEFGGVAILPVVIKALIQETRSLVYQTAVLTVDDFREREKDLALKQIPKDAPDLDKNYLLLSQAHLCVQYHKLDLAAALYSILQEWYGKAQPAEQRAIYEDIVRFYDEYCLVSGAQSTLNAKPTLGARALAFLESFSKKITTGHVYAADSVPANLQNEQLLLQKQSVQRTINLVEKHIQGVLAKLQHPSHRPMATILSAKLDSLRALSTSLPAQNTPQAIATIRLQAEVIAREAAQAVGVREGSLQAETTIPDMARNETSSVSGTDPTEGAPALSGQNSP